MSIAVEETGKYGFVASIIFVVVAIVVAAPVILVMSKKKFLCLKAPGYSIQEQQHKEPEKNENPDTIVYMDVPSSEDEREDDTGSDERLLPADEDIDVEGAANEDEGEDDTGPDGSELPADENVDVEGAANEDEGEDDTGSDGSENAGSADDVIADDHSSGPRGKEELFLMLDRVINQNYQVFAGPMHDLNVGGQRE